MPADYTVRVVTFREGEWYVAQCLEWDLATQARSPEALLDEVRRLLTAHVVAARETGREPFANLPAAPLRFHRMWELARDSGDLPLPLPDREPSPHVLLRSAA